VEDTPVESLPASFLQGHPDVRFIVDQAAGGELTRIKHPWLVGAMEWDSRSIRKAINWLSSKVDKPILKLLDEDYNEQGLGDLLTQSGPAYSLNIKVFNDVQHTLTGWPGGKPNADDTHRPERAGPHPKRVLILAPEPQDAVLGMGGTIHRLVDQGHEVALAYLTSGNLAVPDSDAIKATELILDIANAIGDSENTVVNEARNVRKELLQKGEQSTDSKNIRLVKAHIRRGEARAACQECDLTSDRIIFLDLPFYENGRYRQFNLTDEDSNAVTELLREIKPHQVYITGSQADPSSVQALGFETVRRALVNCLHESWFSDCFVWLFRSQGREWDIHELDMAVPLSPDELARKTKGIYQHQTQRNQAPMSRHSTGEAWQQAEAADHRLANLYDSLGMAEYEAIEGFRRLEIL
jgi:glucosamine-6-phosphate deaminase